MGGEGSVAQTMAPVVEEDEVCRRELGAQG